GHLAGDTVLQQVGKILQNLKRQSDYVFRYGGEEFILILSQSNTNGAILVAERIRQQIAHHEFCFEGKKMAITASIGLSHFYPQDNFHTLFQRVDKALYQAKGEGKNRIITY
ncbi:MAG TPA: GGDEF domain-containing protein, partial [Candidatus Berkiella sp.]|nr:GGDEF domain-containing protein [Candidatus Berkiella sp.]